MGRLTVKRFARMFLILVIVSLPMPRSPDAERLHAAMQATCNTTNLTPNSSPQSDRGLGGEVNGLIDSIRQAYRWNALLDKRVAAIDQNYYSIPELLQKIESWTPMITCVAQAFQIPPALLAGILATELDLDYHVVDAVADNVVRTSPFGEVLGYVVMGAGYAGVHFDHLKRALATIPENFSASPLFNTYRQIVRARNNRALTVLATRDSLFDIADAAVMARYYMLIRLGNRSAHSLTATDMAFIWSAYRGGVKDSPADLPEKRDYRWSADYLQRADNPNILGDTLIGLPYFSYYRTVFKSD